MKRAVKLMLQCCSSLTTHIHHSTDTVAPMHQLECIVDLSKWLAVRDELVHFKSALEVVRHQPWEL